MLNPKVKKIAKIAGGIIISLAALCGSYYGYMYFFPKSENSGESDNVGNPPADADIEDLASSAALANINATNIAALKIAAKKNLSKMEVQRLSTFYKKLASKTTLTSDENIEYNMILTSLKS